MRLYRSPYLHIFCDWFSSWMEWSTLTVRRRSEMENYSCFVREEHDLFCGREEIWVILGKSRLTHLTFFAFLVWLCNYFVFHFIFLLFSLVSGLIEYRKWFCWDFAFYGQIKGDTIRNVFRLNSPCCHVRWRWFPHRGWDRIAKTNIKERDIDHNMKIFVRKSTRCGSSVMNYNPIKLVERREREKYKLTPNIARKSGSLNLNGMFDTWRRFGWDFESVAVEVIDVVVVDITDVVVSDTFVCTPDVNVVGVAGDVIGDLASELALMLSASVWSENSLIDECAMRKLMWRRDKDFCKNG